jgi:hypothetical protein
MSARNPSIAGSPARPGVEVRADGVLLKRVSAGAADELVSRGWGEWIGTGRRRYLRLTESAPVSALHGWRGGDGTQPLRGDRTCKRYGDGQLMGDPRRLREFIPQHQAKLNGTGGRIA